MAIMRDEEADEDKRTIAQVLLEVILGCRDWRVGTLLERPKDILQWTMVSRMFDNEA